MKTLLYIIANSKDEEQSASRTVSRALVNRLLLRMPELRLREINLYEDHIPQLRGEYFRDRNAVVDAEDRDRFNEHEKKELERIEALAEEFAGADVYVLAAPMWSLSFPAPVKEYLDCVAQDGKTLSFAGKRPRGLLGDRPRTFFYVQSSGARIPALLSLLVNRGAHYVHMMVRMMGIRKFVLFPVDGTGSSLAEMQEAAERAKGKINAMLQKHFR